MKGKFDMAVKVNEIEKSLSDIDFQQLISQGKYTSSPDAWEDETLYFLMLDRFSDGNENEYIDNNGDNFINGKTSPYHNSDNANAIMSLSDADIWNTSGGKWAGGNIKGLITKIGYLKRMGVTALWISPVFRQVSFQETYHGYGIQNFIDIDPHFGTRDDLKQMVEIAHEHGIRVILDIILNHTGNVFSYNYDSGYDGNKHNVKGFNDEKGNPSIPFQKVDLKNNPEAWPSGAVWPNELQDPNNYSQKGYINNWDNYPEFVDGDFCDLKDIHLGEGEMDSYNPSPALEALCKAYKFWIAYADIDGYRIDTVKHMGIGAVRHFVLTIQEFAKSLGKENFYLIGEITGGRENAYHTLELTGLNAALGIDDVQDKMEYMVKGWRNPSDYFNLFRNSLLINKNSHVWFRDKIITMLNDHDEVSKGPYKSRFCADTNAEKLVFNALALNIMTLGIPCIYYGTEQAFDGKGGSDKYIRETMFDGNFGAFRSKDRHFFNEDNDIYVKLAEILKIRSDNITLRRGRQYLREISGDGFNFGYPQMINGEMRSIVPWSRIFNDQEILLAINTDYNNQREAWVTVDNNLHQIGDQFICIYSTDKNAIAKKVITVEAKNGKSVCLTVPEAGFVIYSKV